VLAVVTLVAVGLGLYIALGRRGGSAGSDETPELAAGRVLYEANCMECHGESATGDGPLAASLPVPPANILAHLAHHTEDVLVRIVQTGIPPAMPPAEIGDADARLLLGYLESLLPEGVTIGSMGSMDMPMGGMPMDGMHMDGMPMDSMSMPMGRGEMRMGPQGAGMPGMPMGGPGRGMPMDSTGPRP
jgi:mono/diheme cytochrome c family protein